MNYRIVHRTRYRYSGSVVRSVHLAHLRPRPLAHQEVRQFSMALSPKPTEHAEEQDYFGNPTDAFVMEGPHKTFKIETIAEVTVRPRFSSPAGQGWEEVSAAIVADRSPEGLRVREFLGETGKTPRLPVLVEYAQRSFVSGRPFEEAVLDLTERIHQDYRFDAGATTVATPLEQVVRKRRGVCQDFAHLMIACLRTLRLPARYMSGYLRTRPPAGQPRLVGVDASHAWVGVFSPRGGWLEVDPTNNRVADQDFITLGWGRDYSDVSPIRGVMDGGGHHTLRLSVDVSEIDEPAGQPA